MPMESVAQLIKDEGLLGMDQGALEEVKVDRRPYLEGAGVRIYRRSLYLRDKLLYFIASVDGKKSLYFACEKSFKSEFQGVASRAGGIHLFGGELSKENAETLHRFFPFTAPVSLRDRTTTIGCGDRLGLATPGHIRAVLPYDVSPVLAQQSIRELTLTKRDFRGVVADVTFLVFQEGFERGYGADGDHLKTLKDIDVALEAKMPMITLDLTEVMHPQPASWSAAKIDTEFERLDEGSSTALLDRYADRTFRLANSTIVFDRTEVKRCALMYSRALDFSRDVDRHLKERRPNGYDLEISIDETTAPTLPSHHLFIASELERRGVAVNSLAPRFIGEFQKGIDYIGEVAEFERQFIVHCDIARAYGGYKISIHSGSDKFSVYPAIGTHTGMRLHLKTAGTSWLVAVEVIARTNPVLFRKMLSKAFGYFPEATKLYHVTTDLKAIRSAAEVPDGRLEEFVREPNSRQLLHITYGGLLNDSEIREEFFATLRRFEELHYDAVQQHMEKHIALLGAPKLKGAPRR